jgi:hypothetical protein
MDSENNSCVSSKAKLSFFLDKRTKVPRDNEERKLFLLIVGYQMMALVN